MAVAVPVNAAEDQTTNRLYTFYGTDNNQEVWAHTVTDLDNLNDGFILDWFGHHGDLSPSTLYFWGRTNGQFNTLFTAENSEDFIIGTEFTIGEENSSLQYFLAQEKVQYGTVRGANGETLINLNYTGLGTRWTQDQFTASVAAWWDYGDNYRLTATADITPLDDLVIRPTVWVMVGDDVNNNDPWAWWQLMLEYPINDNYNACAYYEDSQLTDGIVMVGFSYEL